MPPQQSHWHANNELLNPACFTLAFENSLLIFINASLSWEVWINFGVTTQLCYFELIMEVSNSK